MVADTGPVVACVDLSTSAAAVARRAGQEAMRRHTGLRIVAAVAEEGADLAFGRTAIQCALRIVLAAMQNVDTTLIVDSRIHRGDISDVVVAESQRAAVLFLPMTGIDVQTVIPLARSPVHLVTAGHAPATGADHDRWVIAVIPDSTVAVPIMTAALGEAQWRGAAVMALTPRGHDAAEFLIQSGFVDNARTPEVWAVPKSDDPAALIAEHADLDQLVVASAEDAELVSDLSDRCSRAHLCGTVEILILPSAREYAPAPARRGSRVGSQ